MAPWRHLPYRTDKVQMATQNTAKFNADISRMVQDKDAIFNVE